jgi:hypothetical protein
MLKASRRISCVQRVPSVRLSRQKLTGLFTGQASLGNLRVQKYPGFRTALPIQNPLTSHSFLGCFISVNRPLLPTIPRPNNNEYKNDKPILILNYRMAV